MTPAEADARWNIRLYYVFEFFMDFGLWFGVWIKYLTVYRGFELKWVLLMDTPFWLLVATLEAPFGGLADRIGRKKVLGLGAGIYSAVVFGFGFTTNYWLLFIDYSAWAFAMAARSGAGQALIYDSMKAAGTQAQFSKVAGRGFAVMLTAGVVSVLLGGVVAEATSLAFVVRVSAIFPLVAVFAAVAMREPHFEPSGRHYLHDMKEGIAFTWRHPTVRWSVLLLAAVMGAGFTPVVLMQPFLIEQDVATGLFGVYQAPLRILAVLAAVVAYRVATLMGAGRLMAAGGAGMVIAFSGLAAFDELWAFGFFALPAMIQGFVRPTMDAYINHRTPSSMRATVLSVSSLCLSLQLAIFEPILGFLTDEVSLQAASGFAAVVFALVLPPLVVVWARADRKHPLEDDPPAAMPAGP